MALCRHGGAPLPASKGRMVAPNLASYFLLNRSIRA